MAIFYFGRVTVEQFSEGWYEHFTSVQVEALLTAGFTRVSDRGELGFNKRVVYNQLPQDDIEDVMSPDDIILGKEEVIVRIYAEDGSISIETAEAYVGPLAANTEVAQKILASCF
jgi:hypothetical protein